MKQKKSYLSTLKWGLVLGIGLAVFEVVKMYARRLNYSNSSVFDLVLILGYILVLYAGIKEFKQYYTERLTFAKAFLGCIIVSVIGCMIFFCYGMIHYAVIEPDGLEKRYEFSLNNFRESIANDTIRTDEMAAYMDSVAIIFKTEERALSMPDTLTETTRQEIHLGISKIADFHKRKIVEKRALDNADHYRMRNFQPYVRKVLMETLESYIAQNSQKSSTPYVQLIVQDVNLTLADLDPVDIRYEQNKSHVPHYDQPGLYAALSSMMYLLYGMFIGIFIAMYHYTSKRTAIEEAGETPIDVDPYAGFYADKTSEENIENIEKDN